MTFDEPGFENVRGPAETAFRLPDHVAFMLGMGIDKRFHMVISRFRWIADSSGPGRAA